MSKCSIQVGIKIRPQLLKERDLPCLWQVKGNSIQLTDSQSEPHFFDYIFDQDATNDIIFEKMAKHIVHACVQGFNGTIFAYGQTSSGKTYTMMGNENNPGVMVLAAKEIFKQIEQNADRQFLLRVGYIEIYNEKIYDLLNKKNQDLKIHETPTSIVSVNCEENIITCEEDLLQYLCHGNKERTVGETNMNERSSRSHAIFRIIIESRKTNCIEDDAVIQSVLNLVDLAGSERADQTGARGARLKEGGHINKSLLFLSNVIKRLSENEDHKYISYRDSKLTRILQASLGGNALTSIICTIKPTIVEETLSTLNFAIRAKAIKNKPQLNEIVSEATMMKRLEREIKELKDRLAEELRKNEGQINVGMLEKRIKSDMHKIISCNSLNNTRNLKEKRRRTWCPTTSLPEAAAEGASTSNLPIPSLVASTINQNTQLPKPNFSSNINAYVASHNCVPKTVNVFKSLDDKVSEENDNFQPAEEFDFGSEPNVFHTPKTQNDIELDRMRIVKLTPNLRQMGSKSLEMVEQEFLELQQFTNLENQIGVQHEQYAALKQKYEIISVERDRLENERIAYIQMKYEFDDTKQSLTSCQERCDELQIQISKFTNEKQIADEKIEKYEMELAGLKTTIAKLELENREAVSLEFEFERHKNKSQLRETELLFALSEKETEIVALKRNLDSVTKEAIHYNKDRQIQWSRSETRIETDEICMKCKDMQGLQEAHQKLSDEFEKLKLEYDKLHLDYQQVLLDMKSKKIEFEKLEKLRRVEAAESEKLRFKVNNMCTKLEKIQTDYEQINNERNEKTEACRKLSRVLEIARSEMGMLQEKYDQLQLERQEQLQIMKGIQSDYDAIQQKYDDLLIEYEKLKQAPQSSDDICDKLQNENKILQSEISLLKARVEDAQRSLLEASKKNDLNTENSELKQNNHTLQVELENIQRQFNELQQEYDDLSNQLLENIQECDALRAKCEKLEIEKINTPIQQTTHQNNSLASYLPCYGNADSMSSSAVYTESNNHEDNELFTQFFELVETLHEIELENLNGNSRIFKADSHPLTGLTTSVRKLCIRNIKDIVKKDLSGNTDFSGKICLQGLMKQNKFCIIEREADSSDLKNDLESYISELEKDITEKNILIEATEQTIKEMREEMRNLESALLEKTIIVEKVGDYQKQIECLEKQNAEITIVCEELQEKFKESTVEGSSIREASDQKISSSFVSSVEDYQLKNKNEDKIDILNAELNNKIHEMNVNVELIKELKEEIRKLGEIKFGLESKILELEKLINDQSVQLEAGNSLINSMQSEIDDLKVNYHVTKSETEKLRESYEEKYASFQTALEKARMELKSRETEYKVELNRLNLELYEKLELNETENRKNLRKYNEKLEESRLKYDQSLAELHAKLLTSEELLQKQKNEHLMEISTLKSLHFTEVEELRHEKCGLELAKDNFKNDLDAIQIQLTEKKKYATEQLELLAKVKAELNISEQSAKKNFEEYGKFKLESDARMHELITEKMQLKSELEVRKKEIGDLKEKLATYLNLEVDYKNILEMNKTLKAECLVKEDKMYAYEAITKQHERTIEEKNRERNKLNEELACFIKKMDDAENMIETLNLKIEELTNQLKIALENSLTYEKLLNEQESIKKLLDEAVFRKIELEQKVEDLEKNYTTALQNVETQNVEIERLQNDVEQVNSAKFEAIEKQKALECKYKAFEIEADNKIEKFQKECKDLQSSHIEIELKYDVLHKLNENLDATVVELSNQLKKAIEKCNDYEELRNALQQLRSDHNECKEVNAAHEKLLVKYAELEKRMNTIAEETSKSSQALKDQVLNGERLLQERTEEYNNLNALLEAKKVAFNKEREKLEGTIACLLSEKTAMVERMHSAEQAFKKLETELMAQKCQKFDSTNTSFESNNSLSPPVFRKSLEVENHQLKSINVNVEDKLHALQQNSTKIDSQCRRMRRLSSHDEHRRQSYWSFTRNVGLMTDQMAINCQCEELKIQLKDCERNLYIREGQVKSLRMDIKNHPLKDENVVLKKRLQEEQDKCRVEIKRLKQKNHDLLSKVNTLTAETAGSIATETASKVMGNVETQTDSDIDACIQKLQGKNNDLISICRHRYVYIKELEQKINQKENSDSSNISSLEAGQIKALKSQNESLKKELSVTKEKFENAKLVLTMRRKEIQKLQEKLDSNCVASPL